MRCEPILVLGLAAAMLAEIPAGAVSQQEPKATFRTGADVVAVEEIGRASCRERV